MENIYHYHYYYYYNIAISVAAAAAVAVISSTATSLLLLRSVDAVVIMHMTFTKDLKCKINFRKDFSMV